MGGSNKSSPCAPKSKTIVRDANELIQGQSPMISEVNHSAITYTVRKPMIQRPEMNISVTLSHMSSLKSKENLDSLRVRSSTGPRASLQNNQDLVPVGLRMGK